MTAEVTLNEDGVLACPECGSESLHQDSVSAWFRPEDADIYTGYRVATGGVRVLGTEGNPSGRRDGMFVTFWCEGGDHQPRLIISQHKGATTVRWFDNSPPF